MIVVLLFNNLIMKFNGVFCEIFNTLEVTNHSFALAMSLLVHAHEIIAHVSKFFGQKAISTGIVGHAMNKEDSSLFGYRRFIPIICEFNLT